MLLYGSRVKVLAGFIIGSSSRSSLLVRLTLSCKYAERSRRWGYQRRDGNARRPEKNQETTILNCQQLFQEPSVSQRCGRVSGDAIGPDLHAKRLLACHIFDRVSRVTPRSQNQILIEDSNVFLLIFSSPPIDQLMKCWWERIQIR